MSVTVALLHSKPIGARRSGKSQAALPKPVLARVLIAFGCAAQGLGLPSALLQVPPGETPEG